jgi:hypothetical protein
MTYPTQGLPRNQTIEIGKAPKAKIGDGITAFLTDLRRRHKAGELRSLHIVAKDRRGNTLDYDTAR